MHKLLQLAATLALTAPACAQIRNPDTLVAPPPRNPAHTAVQPTTDYQWLWQYAKPAPSGNKHDLTADARFQALLADNFKAPQAMWGMGVPLSDAARIFLGGEGIVASTDNRHLTITGCVVDHCPQRGMLYADLGEPNPLIVFAALRWTEEGHTTDEKNAVYTLWLFPNRALDPKQLPESLKNVIDTWRTNKKPCDSDNASVLVGIAIVVDPDGVPHVTTPGNTGVQTTFCATSSGIHL